MAQNLMVIKSGKSQTEEHQLPFQGEMRWFLSNRQPIRNSSGDITSALTIATDITERKRAEEELQKSEERFRTIVETAPSFLLIENAKGNTIYASPNCEEIISYTQEELLNKKIWWVNEEDMPKSKELYDRTFQKGEGYRNFDYKAIKKNGEIRYFSSSWEPFRDKK